MGQQQQQMNLKNNQQQQQQQQIHQECLSERHLCKVEKKWCIEKLEKERLPREEAERICEKKLVFCTMKSQSRSVLKTALRSVEKGTALSVSLGAILRGSQKSEEKKSIKSTLLILKSDEHKEYIRQSPVYERCIK